MILLCAPICVSENKEIYDVEVYELPSGQNLSIIPSTSYPPLMSQFSVCSVSGYRQFGENHLRDPRAVDYSSSLW